MEERFEVVPMEMFGNKTRNVGKKRMTLQLLLQKMVQCVQSSITTKDVYTTVLPKLRLPKDALDVLAGMGRHAPIPDKLRVALARWRDLQPTPAAGTERLIRIFDVFMQRHHQLSTASASVTPSAEPPNHQLSTPSASVTICRTT
ncbi:hypothetical protein Bbelb_243570 [Branchiostoma belcheri]|nr:hypothetical protein Bbelb_243570 [Branchiostoma belcheri]